MDTGTKRSQRDYTLAFLYPNPSTRNAFCTAGR